MRRPEQQMIERLEAMSLDEARRMIATGGFGDIGSPNHSFCMSWLQAKDVELQHARESEALAISRDALSNSKLATRIAIAALILTLIGFGIQYYQWRG